MTGIIELHMSKEPHPRLGDTNDIKDREERIIIAEVLFLMFTALIMFIGFLAFIIFCINEISIWL